MKPFLSLRKNGVWYIVDREKSLGRAKWISTREKDRDEAEKKLDCYIAEQRADELESPSGAPRLSQYAEEFLAHAETKKGDVPDLVEISLEKEHGDEYYPRVIVSSKTSRKDHRHVQTKRNEAAVAIQAFS